MFHRNIFTLCLVLLVLPISAQKKTYRSPVNHAIVLAGTFGELRSSHFHAGIDIKPSSAKTPDTIFAIADGFLSRIKTQRGGFGRAIYLDHPDGNTSVYGHLSKFLDPVASLVFKKQMEDMTYEVDIYPPQDSIKIKKGQPIGLMGNAGNSYGAHLHFEIRDTKSEVPLHPFAYGIKPRDNIRPTIVSVGIHGINPSWSDTHYTNIGKSFAKDEVGAMVPQFAIPAWRVGLGIEAFDQMNGAPNKNGYYMVKMFVDDTLYFHSEMDKVSYDESDMMDAYIDFPLKRVYKRTEALLYKLPSNEVTTIKYTKNDGAFQIFAGIKRKICVQVTDFEGNESSAYFDLIRDTSMIGNRQIKSYDFAIPADKPTKVEIDNFSFSMPANTLAKDGGISISAYGKSFTLGDADQAVLKSFDYCISVPEEMMEEEHLLLANVGGSKPSTKGGKINGNLYCGKLDNYGNYRFIIDVNAPTIVPVNFSQKAVGKTTFTFKISDDVNYRSPAKSFTYKVFLDGHFVPCELKELTGILTIPIQDVAKGEHILEIMVEDSSNNGNIYKKSFVK